MRLSMPRHSCGLIALAFTLALAACFAEPTTESTESGADEPSTTSTSEAAVIDRPAANEQAEEPSEEVETRNTNREALIEAHTLSRPASNSAAEILTDRRVQALEFQSVQPRQLNLSGDAATLRVAPLALERDALQLRIDSQQLVPTQTGPGSATNTIRIGQ